MVSYGEAMAIDSGTAAVKVLELLITERVSPQVYNALETDSIARHIRVDTLGYLCVAHKPPLSKNMCDLYFRLTLHWTEVDIVNFSLFGTLILSFNMEMSSKIHIII